jgi:hypothetical protein
MEHLAYSPDLAMNNYHLFPALKDHLGSHKFQSDDEVKTAVTRSIFTATQCLQFQPFYFTMKTYWWYTEIVKFHLVVHQQNSLETLL